MHPARVEAAVGPANAVIRDAIATAAVAHFDENSDPHWPAATTGDHRRHRPPDRLLHR